jgi:hypothetical protein
MCYRYKGACESRSTLRTIDPGHVSNQIGKNVQPNYVCEIVQPLFAKFREIIVTKLSEIN